MEDVNVCICSPTMESDAIMDFIRQSGKSVAVIVVDDAAAEPRIEDMCLDNHMVSHPIIKEFELKKMHDAEHHLVVDRRCDDPWRYEKKDKRFK